MPCNEADAARSDCLNGKKMAIRIENKNKKNVQVNVLEKNLYIAENELIIKMQPFFYE
jgi:SHS2 domain-containing protein